MTAELLFARWRDRIESQLDAALPSPAEAPQRLHQAMRYSVLGGGKRMRPLLVYASGQLFGAQAETLDAAAMAVELIHAYSLVHDDLPAMDDDALRRGKPTTHIAFDEATAILAGDALQTRAFGLLADAPLPATLRVACLQTLAHASGASGMCGGQALDIDATGQQQSLAALTRMHALKTGALIRAAVRMGALCGQAHEPGPAGSFRRRARPGVPGARRHPRCRSQFRTAGQDRRQGPGTGQEHLPRAARHGRRQGAAA